MISSSTFIDIFQNHYETQGEKLLFRFVDSNLVEQHTLTIAQLHDAAASLAAKLNEITSKGERALLMYTPGLDFIVAFLACLYSGVIAVPLYPPRKNRSIRRILHIIHDAKPSLILTNVEIDDPNITNGISLLNTSCLDNELKIRFCPVILKKNDIAFLQYTSGSTGQPKGVMVSHGNLLHNAQLIYQAFGFSSATVAATWLPLFHDMGLIGHVIEMIYAAIPCSIMAPFDFIRRPVNWLKLISQYDITVSGGPNFAFDYCVNRIAEEELRDIDLSCLENFYCGSEPISAETIRKFCDKFSSYGFNPRAFYACYGMAESTLLITGAKKFSGLKTTEFLTMSLNKTEINEKQEITSCGVIHPDIRIKIVDPATFQELPSEKIGEIWLSGESVAQGYWNNPSLTTETFYAKLAYQSDSYLRTGDLGFISHGELFITGRLKDLIIINGINYYPHDIEDTVVQTNRTQVQAAAAFSIVTNETEKLVVFAEVTRHFLKEKDKSTFIQSVRRLISFDYEISLDALILLLPGKLPRTSSGKLQRYLCREAFLTKDYLNWSAELVYEKE